MPKFMAEILEDIRYLRDRMFPKMRVYVLRNRKYQRVIGPAELMKTVNAVGGFMVIGDTFQIHSGMFFSGSNSISGDSLNGFDIEEMEFAPIDAKDKRILGISLNE